MKKYYRFFITILIIQFLVHNSKAQNAQIWATYYGGVEIGINEGGNGTCTDSKGNVYIVATVSNSGLATPGAYQTVYGGANRDAMLIKFDSTGNRLWATYYGGSGLDNGNDVIVDKNDNVYLLGQTTASTGLATVGAHQTALSAGLDAFLVKFDSSGTRLWATYYGGTGADVAARLAIDTANNVYFVGMSNGSNGISFNGFQNTYGGGQDIYLVKFDQNGTRLWATYYGGSGSENATYGYISCTVDCHNNVYAAAVTRSSTGIASGGFQNTISGTQDGFLVKFDASGNRIWGTYYGGPGSPGIFGINDFDGISDIGTDMDGNVYIVGNTTSSTGVAFNAFDTVQTYVPISTLSIAYLAKFDLNGNRLWGTYYGETFSQSTNLTIDDCGNAFFTGRTNDVVPPSYDYATPGVFQDTLGGGYDAFLAMFDPLGNRVGGTYFGNTNTDQPYGLSLDNLGNIYMVGYTRSTTGIATPGAFKTTMTGTGDIFLTKFTTLGCPNFTLGACLYPLQALVSSTNDSCYQACKGTATVVASYGLQPYSYSWSNGDTTAYITDLCAGTYVITVTDSLLNTVIDSVTITEPAQITFNQSLTECQGFSITVGSNTYTSTGIYTDTLTTASGCDSIVTTNLTIIPADDATFSYAQTTYCSNSINPTATISGTAGGTFSASGGIVDPLTGEIDIAGSGAGLVSVTYTTSGPCPDIFVFDVTIV
ncbi:MAG TPA: hypothetical protein EYN64_02530, partial [Flavobacteriales bacterium]|nr:hypothetical protein [Flavobacteriales bacterium]